MFYIYTSTPRGDSMDRYEWDEMVELFGAENAAKLRDGVSVMDHGYLHINAAHAAVREAADILGDD